MHAMLTECCTGKQQLTLVEHTSRAVTRAGFSWWEAWGQLVGGQCPAIT